MRLDTSSVDPNNAIHTHSYMSDAPYITASKLSFYSENHTYSYLGISNVEEQAKLNTIETV